MRAIRCWLSRRHSLKRQPWAKKVCCQHEGDWARQGGRQGRQAGRQGRQGRQARQARQQDRQAAKQPGRQTAILGAMQVGTARQGSQAGSQAGQPGRAEGTWQQGHGSRASREDFVGGWLCRRQARVSVLSLGRGTSRLHETWGSTARALHCRAVTREGKPLLTPPTKVVTSESFQCSLRTAPQMLWISFRRW